MAWRSSGSDNDEMVSNLKRFGVIRSPAVEEAFRAVDRRFFVPRNVRQLAHSDQPLREGNVHISAPHMYGSVVEALDLLPNSCTSFLNLGSGTGYLSCIVAHVLGPASSHYAVDIHDDVIDHSRRAIQEWQESQGVNGRNLSYMEVLHGNALCINKDLGEAVVGFDRIYIGAAVEKHDLNSLAQLLKVGGVLVGPVEDELVKVRRVQRTNGGIVNSLPRSLRGHPPPLSVDFSLEVISSVRFFPMSRGPDIPVVFPTRVWSPERHHIYPRSFREATKQILLCSHSPEIQPLPPAVAERRNVANKLPGFLWMEIFSYTRRDWFEKGLSEEELLKIRLREEQSRAASQQERLVELESRLREAERASEMYRLMNIRLKRRLHMISSDEAPSHSSGDYRMTGGTNAIAFESANDAPFLVQLLDRVDARVAMYNRALDQQDSESEDGTEEDENVNREQELDMDEYSMMSTESEVLRGTVDESIGMARPHVRSVSIARDD